MLILVERGKNHEIKLKLVNENLDNARNMFNFGDQNGDGQLSFEEFVALTATFVGYSERQIEKIMVMPEMREIFEQFDTNEDGQLSFEEFEVAYGWETIDRFISIIHFFCRFTR